MLNFNISLMMSKAVKAINDNKKFRTWSYILVVLMIVGIFVFKSADIILSIAELLEVLRK